MSSRNTKSPATARRRGRPLATDDINKALLDAAAVVYADCGFHGTTVEKVLNASGVSRPTFYRYYRDKDELLTAVVATTNARLVQELFRRVAPIKEPNRQVAEAVSVYLDWGLSVGKLARVLWGEIHMPESPVGRDREKLIEMVLQFFQGQAAYFKRPAADPIVYEALIAVIEAVASKAFIRGNVTPQEIATRKAVILRVFFSTLAVTPQERDSLPELPLMLSSDASA